MSQSPLTADEMRAMLRDSGDSVVDIAAKARLRNGISRAKVREILFEGGEL